MPGLLHSLYSYSFRNVFLSRIICFTSTTALFTAPFPYGTSNLLRFQCPRSPPLSRPSRISAQSEDGMSPPTLLPGGWPCDSDESLQFWLRLWRVPSAFFNAWCNKVGTLYLVRQSRFLSMSNAGVQVLRSSVWSLPAVLWNSGRLSCLLVCDMVWGSSH